MICVFVFLVKCNYIKPWDQPLVREMSTSAGIKSQEFLQCSFISLMLLIYRSLSQRFIPFNPWMNVPWENLCPTKQRGKSWATAAERQVSVIFILLFRGLMEMEMISVLVPLPSRHVTIITFTREMHVNVMEILHCFGAPNLWVRAEDDW